MQTPSLKFGKHIVGEGYPCFIIAEACVNHLGRMDLAKELISQSKKAGADAVKFQYHIADAEMLPDVSMSDNFEESFYEFIKKKDFTFDQHRELKAFADEVGITYLCTPFSTQAALELDTLGLTAYKIGSGEMTDIASLERIAECGKPMMLSTGMSDWEEIDRTYEAMARTGVPFALLNCLSEYPPAYEDMNVDVIAVMRQRYPKAVIGHSDHSPDLFTSFAAVVLGAKIIEKHVILDKSHKSPDTPVSITFDKLAELVDGIRKIEAARGTEKKVHPKEEVIRSWAFHYAVAERGLRKGQTITEEMLQPGHIWTKRTGRTGGIRSEELRLLIGRKARRDILPNSPLTWEDIEAGENVFAGAGRAGSAASRFRE